jgi:beta-phosphoglucomutase
MAVAAVILDMDGLMVDTEPLYQVAWQQAASELGYHLDDALYARFVGRPTEDCERILLEEYGSSFPLAVFQGRWPGLWREQVEHCGVQTKPGLLELLTFIEEQCLPAAVATSSAAAYADFTLRQAGLADRFAVVVSGDQVVRGKPAPDIYLEAARRLRVSAADCVALEDSEAGIRAVARAGMIGVLVPHWPASPEAVHAASQVVETLHEARQVLATLMSVNPTEAKGERT